MSLSQQRRRREVLADAMFRSRQRLLRRCVLDEGDVEAVGPEDAEDAVLIAYACVTVYGVALLKPRASGCEHFRTPRFRGPTPIRRWHVLTRHLMSSDGDGTHVDGDQQWVRDALVVALPGVASPRGGDDDAVDVTVVAGVEHAGRPADNVDGEVMAT